MLTTPATGPAGIAAALIFSEEDLLDPDSDQGLPAGDSDLNPNQDAAWDFGFQLPTSRCHCDSDSLSTS